MVLVSTGEEESHSICREVMEWKVMLIEDIFRNQLSKISLQLSKCCESKIVINK